MMTGRLPDWLYRPLPYLYACAGLLAVALANNAIAVVSGVALVTAGALVWWMRFQYRRQREQARGEDARGETAGEAADGPGRPLMRICWRKSYETGHEVLDAQHRALFALGNELVNSIVNCDPPSRVRQLLERVLRHIEEHFQTEETIVAAMRHPLAEEHAAIHRSLLGRAKALAADFREGKTPSRELLQFVLFDLVTDHLMTEDVKFYEKLVKKVGRPAPAT